MSLIDTENTYKFGEFKVYHNFKHSCLLQGILLVVAFLSLSLSLSSYLLPIASSRHATKISMQTVLGHTLGWDKDKGQGG